MLSKQIKAVLMLLSMICFFLAAIPSKIYWLFVFIYWVLQFLQEYCDDE